MVINSKNYIKQLWPATIRSRRCGKRQQVNPALIRYFEEYSGGQGCIIVSFHAQINGDEELRYLYSST